MCICVCAFMCVCACVYVHKGMKNWDSFEFTRPTVLHSFTSFNTAFLTSDPAQSCLSFGLTTAGS